MEPTKDYPPPGSKTLGQILEDLRRPIHAKYISTKKVPIKKGGSFEADYIQHATLRDLLDDYAPGWSSQLRLEHIGGKVYVICSITIVGSDGHLMREGIGNEDDVVSGYGDPSSNASAMAHRRAAMSLGLGRQLWRKP